MLRHVDRYPVFFAFSSFLLGLFLSNSPARWYLVVALSPFLGFISLRIPKLTFLLFIPIGIAFSTTPIGRGDRVANYINKRVILYGVLYRSPERRFRGYDDHNAPSYGSRLFIDSKAVMEGNTQKPVYGKVLIYSKSEVRGLIRGDRVAIVHITLRPLYPIKGLDALSGDYYERQGVYAIGFIDGAETIKYMGRSGGLNSLFHITERLRERFGSYVREKFPVEEAEVLLAITTGDKGGISQGLRESFSKAGVSHLLAISGLHVAGIAAFFYFAILWLMKRSTYLLLRFTVPKLAAAITIVPLSFYLFIAGVSPPVTRAFIMCSCYLLGVLLGRKSERLNILSLSALVILVISPSSVYDLSFQLSFLSIVGILFINKFMPLGAQSYGDVVFSLVKTTLGATLATLPLVINAFGILPLLSIPANLLLIPLVELMVVPLGVVSLLSWLISEGVASYVVYLALAGAKLLVLGATIVSDIPWSYVRVSGVTPFAWVMYLISLISFVASYRYPKVKPLVPLCSVFFLVLFVYGARLTSHFEENLSLHFMNYKGRRLMFARLPGGRILLLDSGNHGTRGMGYIEKNVIAPFVSKKGYGGIDYLILTRLSHRSLRGVSLLLERLPVRMLLTPGSRLNGEIWDKIYRGELSWMDYSSGSEPLGTDKAKVAIIAPRGGNLCLEHGEECPVLVRISFNKITALVSSGGFSKGWLEDFDGEGSGMEGIIKPSVLYIPRLKDESMLAEFVSLISPELIVTEKMAGQAFRTFPIRKVYEIERDSVLTVLSNGENIKVTRGE